MNGPVPTALLVAAVAALSAGCGEKPTAPPPTPEPQTSASVSSQTGGEKIDVEDPKAGLNTNRPDSIKDIKPGTP